MYLFRLDGSQWWIYGGTEVKNLFDKNNIHKQGFIKLGKSIARSQLKHCDDWFQSSQCFLPFSEGVLRLMFKNNILVKVHACAIRALFLLVNIIH